MPKIANPVYVPTAGYCMNGFYPGFTGPSGANSIHNAIVALENFLDTNIEAISLGMPNDMGDVTGFISSIAGAPQHIVATLPLGNLNSDPNANGLGTSEVGSLTRVLAGDYDARIADMAAKLIAAGWTGNRMTIRLGWEWDGTWTWGMRGFDAGAGGIANTPAMYKAAYRYVVGKFRLAGWTGNFDWNGPARSSDPTTYDAAYPGNDFSTGSGSAMRGGCQVVGYDFYDGIGNAAFYSTDETGKTNVFDAVGSSTFPTKYRYGYRKSEYQNTWVGEAKARLDSVAAFARAHGLLMGIAECGHITHHTNRFTSNDNPYYWPLLWAWIVANADVCSYVCPFNQNIVGSEDDAMFVWNGYKGTVPTASWTGDTIVATAATVSGAVSPAGMTAGTQPPSLGSVDNGNRNATGTWSNSPSPNQAINRPTYIANFKAGNMVFASAPAPALTEHHRLENFPLSSAKLTQLWTTAPTTTPWANAPDGPTIQVARSSDGTSATVTWTPPSFDGGSPITGYLAARDGVDAAGNGAYTSPLQPATARTWTFLNLTSSSYRVTVYAVNGVGQSVPVTVVLPAAGTLGAVTDLVVTASTDTTAALTWTAIPGATSYRVDVSAGLAAQTGDYYVDIYHDSYSATAIPTGVAHGSTGFVDTYTDVYSDTYGTPTTVLPPPLAVSVTLISSLPSATVDGLTPNTAYVVHVTPIGPLGPGPTSAPTSFRTLLANTGGSGSGGDTNPPAVPLPVPDFFAFPVGASLRPTNFGVKVANNG